MVEGVLSGALIVLAVTFLAASLVCLVGVGGNRNLQSAMVRVGFALLAGCFAWLWAV